MADGWALLSGLLNSYALGTFLERCQSLVVGNLVPVGPEGGVGGWELGVKVQVHGA